MPTEATFMSVEEAAALLRISYRSILRRVTDGTIKSIRLGGIIRIPREQFVTHLVIPHPPKHFPTGNRLKESTTSLCRESHAPRQEEAPTPTP